MADPKILYAVTAVVFAGLAVWLAFVFRTAKEPWAVPAGAPSNAKGDNKKKSTAPKSPASKSKSEEVEDDEEEEEDDEPAEAAEDEKSAKDDPKS